MNRKNLFLRILPLLIAVCLINSGHLAGAPTSKINTNLEEYLSTYDISFLVRADLNNDGKEEKVTLYRQWDGEDPSWSDDQWYIICIFDENGDIVYKKDVSYFQEVVDFAVKDKNEDGLKEVIVSLEQAQCWDAKTQVYGWKEDSYRFMGEFKG